MDRRISAVIAAALFALFASARAEAIVYTGTPDLPLTVSMVVAGGGPEHFSAEKLYGVLAGNLAGPEATRLTDQFGKDEVATTFAIFTYAVDDTLRIVTEKHIALPAPNPNPADGVALRKALVRAGYTPSGAWDVGYMLEKLISHPVHHLVMMDIDRKFGKERNAQFHRVLAELMHDIDVADAHAGAARR